MKYFVFCLTIERNSARRSDSTRGAERSLFRVDGPQLVLPGMTCFKNKPESFYSKSFFLINFVHQADITVSLTLVSFG
jgi:hypothetical protein